MKVVEAKEKRPLEYDPFFQRPNKKNGRVDDLQCTRVTDSRRPGNGRAAFLKVQLRHFISVKECDGKRE